jgi:hypothetical protein
MFALTFTDSGERGPGRQTLFKEIMYEGESKKDEHNARGKRIIIPFPHFKYSNPDKEPFLK